MFSCAGTSFNQQSVTKWECQLLMNTENIIGIISVKLIDTMVLQVQFNFDWAIEDSEYLTKKLFLLMPAKEIEQVKGADLYSIRFQYDSYVFLLNFEEYSHSCWFECVTEQDALGLLMIKQIIDNSLA